MVTQKKLHCGLKTGVCAFRMDAGYTQAQLDNALRLLPTKYHCVDAQGNVYLFYKHERQRGIRFSRQLKDCNEHVQVGMLCATRHIGGVIDTLTNEQVDYIMVNRTDLPRLMSKHEQLMEDILLLPRKHQDIRPERFKSIAHDVYLWLYKRRDMEISGTYFNSHCDYVRRNKNLRRDILAYLLRRHMLEITMRPAEDKPRARPKTYYRALVPDENRFKDYPDSIAFQKIEQLFAQLTLLRQ